MDLIRVLQTREGTFSLVYEDKGIVGQVIVSSADRRKLSRGETTLEKLVAKYTKPKTSPKSSSKKSKKKKK